MVVCNVCQGERFDLQDGHYYCVDCHTQALVCLKICLFSKIKLIFVILLP